MSWNCVLSHNIPHGSCVDGTGASVSTNGGEFLAELSHHQPCSMELISELQWQNQPRNIPIMAQVSVMYFNVHY